MNIIKHSQRAYLLLTCTLLGATLHGMEREKPDTSLLTAQKARITTWLNTPAQEIEKESNDQKDTSKYAPHERLRKSSIKLGMNEWVDELTEEMPLTAVEECQLKLQETITDMVLVPYTKKILMAAFNTLYRYDDETKKMRGLMFARPITKLIQSTDGSLCCVLLSGSDEVDPSIHLVNACKSQLGLNSDIEAVPYFQTDEYELGQEADLSSDARYLAVISTPNSACIHDLKTNEPHAIIVKNEQDFPVFSVSFFKNNRSEQLLPAQEHKLAVHADLETTIHAITQSGCSVLRKIDHHPRVPSNEYVPRQCAWILNDRIIVLLGEKLIAFDLDKHGAYAYKQCLCTIDTQNDVQQCSSNHAVLIERDSKKKKILAHHLLSGKTRAFANPSNDRVLIDESENRAIIARKNELLLITKAHPADEAGK